MTFITMRWTAFMQLVSLLMNVKKMVKIAFLMCY